MMRRCFIFLLFFLILFSGFGEKIKMSYFELEPYIIDQGANKKPTGASVEYWELYIAPKMGVETEWSGPLPMLRVLASLENGEIDAIIVLAKNPDRDKRFLFPANSYMDLKPSLCVLKTNPLNKITKVEDMFHLKIGYFDGGYVPPIMKNEKITLDLSKNENYKKDNLVKLAAGKIDAILDQGDISNLIEANKYNLLDKVKMLLIPIDPTLIYTVFQRSDKGKSLASRYEKVNATLFKTDTLEKILAKYTPKAK